MSHRQDASNNAGRSQCIFALVRVSLRLITHILFEVVTIVYQREHTKAAASASLLRCRGFDLSAEECLCLTAHFCCSIVLSIWANSQDVCMISSRVSGARLA